MEHAPRGLPPGLLKTPKELSKKCTCFYRETAQSFCTNVIFLDPIRGEAADVVNYSDFMESINRGEAESAALFCGTRRLVVGRWDVTRGAKTKTRTYKDPAQKIVSIHH